MKVKIFLASSILALGVASTLQASSLMEGDGQQSFRRCVGGGEESLILMETLEEARLLFVDAKRSNDPLFKQEAHRLSAELFEKVFNSPEVLKISPMSNFLFVGTGIYYYAAIHSQGNSNSSSSEFFIDRSVECLEKSFELRVALNATPRLENYLAAANIYSNQAQIKSQSSSYGAEVSRDLALEKACDYFEIYIHLLEKSKFPVKPKVYLDAAHAYLKKSEIKSWDVFFGNESFAYWAVEKANVYFEKYNKAIGL